MRDLQIPKAVLDALRKRKLLRPLWYVGRLEQAVPNKRKDEDDRR
jgi:hypothetical protein